MTHSNTLYPTPIPRLVTSTSSLKSTNKATPDVLSFLAMAILQTEFLNLLTTTSNPSYSPFLPTSKILHTFSFNLNKWDHYQTTPFLSPLMTLHYTLTFLTMKVLKLAAISLTPVKTKHYLLNAWPETPLLGWRLRHHKQRLCRCLSQSSPTNQLDSSAAL